MLKDITFEQVVNGYWRKVYAYEADPAVEVSLTPFIKDEDGNWYSDQDAGTMCTFVRCWDEFFPTSHAMRAEDIHKLYNIFAYANELYKIVAALDLPEAKTLIEKILTDTEVPEGY